jgi:hypothetical protein
MQQIADWLEKLGMSEYAQRFAENGIGFASLRHLTDQDLKDIGVLLGHRRIMLAEQQIHPAATNVPALHSTASNGTTVKGTREMRQSRSGWVRLRDSAADRNTVAARRFLHHWRWIMENNDAEQTDGQIERHAQPNAHSQRICHRVVLCWRLRSSGTIATIDRSTAPHRLKDVTTVVGQLWGIDCRSLQFVSKLAATISP